MEIYCSKKRKNEAAMQPVAANQHNVGYLCMKTARQSSCCKSCVRPACMSVTGGRWNAADGSPKTDGINPLLRGLHCKFGRSMRREKRVALSPGRLLCSGTSPYVVPDKHSIHYFVAMALHVAPRSFHHSMPNGKHSFGHVKKATKPTGETRLSLGRRVKLPGGIN